MTAAAVGVVAGILVSLLSGDPGGWPFYATLLGASFLLGWRGILSARDSLRGQPHFPEESNLLLNLLFGPTALIIYGLFPIFVVSVTIYELRSG